MKIANIYSIKNQEMYKQEEYVMILAHLLDKYDPKNFNSKQYIIMDNGLYENSQVSTKLEDLIELAENSNIPIKEIVIPDVMFDYDENIKLFESSIETIKKWQHKYRFMLIAHLTYGKELGKFFDYIKQYSDLNLTIGIPKKSVYNRTTEEAIYLYKHCIFPIHFLGISKAFGELIPIAKYGRSCDTCQLSALLNENKNIDDFVLSKRCKSYDLKEDAIDIKLLKQSRNKLLEDLKRYGIL